MKQLTVRGSGDELARAIRRLASRDGTSLNRAAVKLMRRGAGLAEGQDADVVAGPPDRDLAFRGDKGRSTRRSDISRPIDEGVWE